jgi:hypothetical protein
MNINTRFGLVMNRTNLIEISRFLTIVLYNACVFNFACRLNIKPQRFGSCILLPFSGEKLQKACRSEHGSRLQLPKRCNFIVLLLRQWKKSKRTLLRKKQGCYDDDRLL